MRKLLLLLPALALVSGLLPLSSSAYIRSEEDLMTGKTNHLQYFFSESKVPNSIGMQEAAEIYVRCEGGKPMDIYVDTPTYNARNNRVQVRWNQGEAQADYWTRSSDGTAFFAPQPESFLKRMIQSDRLVFGWEPYQRADLAVAFNLTSQRADLKRMAKLCGITLP